MSAANRISIHPDANPRHNARQASLKELFYWTAIVAIGLAGLAAVARSSDVSGRFDLPSLLGLLLTPMFMALMSTQIITTILMVAGRSYWIEFWLAVILLVVQQLILLTIGILTSGQIVELLLSELVILATMHVTAALTVWPFRILCVAYVNPQAQSGRTKA